MQKVQIRHLLVFWDKCRESSVLVEVSRIARKCNVRQTDRKELIVRWLKPAIGKTFLEEDILLCSQNPKLGLQQKGSSNPH